MTATAMNEQNAAPQRAAGEALLKILADPNRAHAAADDVAVIVAHPDDETIGCGAQLHRLDNVIVVVATNGAPRDGADARAHGYASPTAYATARERELCNALGLANLPASRILELGFSDQTTAFRLADLARAILVLVAARDIKVVLSHAFEGGHPDHDATAFAVHAVAALRRHHGQTLDLIEMPFYHREDHGWATQRFSRHPRRPAIAVRLNAAERDWKRRMVAAHTTQRATLSAFDSDVERFRLAPAYDFHSLPNRGKLLYEQYNWGLTGNSWLMLSRSALSELGLAGERWF
ncbi:PIG-L deacetylase family protein [Bradyrhizobium sp. sGM-13]|uniref:PIG-L deacetylase family protein n=1 Tax=Bradyrhizobium sp. sGM-13 TaxID=2831781 RepID=UPI001BD19A37|nr:PIG-L family deacetylase [Bradyrhizobium sp. sGM-13]